MEAGLHLHHPRGAQPHKKTAVLPEETDGRGPATVRCIHEASAYYGWSKEMTTKPLCSNVHHILGIEVCGQIRLLYRFEPAAYNITPEKTYDGDITSDKRRLRMPNELYIRLLKIYASGVFIVVLNHIFVRLGTNWNSLLGVCCIILNVEVYLII